MKKQFLIILIFCSVYHGFAQPTGFTNALDFGFSPEASGLENTLALQKAVDRGGTIVVSQPGTYKLAGTVYVGSHTTLDFGNHVFIQKVNERGEFSHVILNKGAFTKTYDQNITIRGLHIAVNKMDVRKFAEAYGLHGQLAFFYVKDLKIERFRCLDLGKMQYGIHVCTFEDLIIDDVIIKGEKDGVHLGRGKRFTIRNGVFQTFDDAVALNAHDYATGNPELGWIENGVIENCHDLNAENTTGYFCRILAGAWTDWKEGMEVQQSDAVVSNGKLYRVQAKPDGTKYISKTRPTHEKGSQMIDGINWGVVQDEVIYTAGVRNVIFRNIFLEKPRIGLSIHFDNDKYSRSYYPGAPIPLQEKLTFDNVRVLHDKPIPFVQIATPVDLVTISNSSIGNNSIKFISNKAMNDYLKTNLLIYGCSFTHNGPLELIQNSVSGKAIYLKTFGNVALNGGFEAKIMNNNGRITIDSDLPGLKK
ncbi:hypothetical protein [Runella slithyformis]|uniref:Pectate lyase superfamily protein domain-containing protein n=1 Tax=Runella slithyformis (strain ATCC 29530 / DSM 19594 / LMG 11500 / NCIMB 11436 / LSU 4) TaxID=761193 RepID=A0A7U4E6L3_RUNSL|nr:hypothetical protein [Runella slithyformis]AEI49698.1 hypothetical protein Runsl_3326 [Runella slithyformis DSM 19594]